MKAKGSRERSPSGLSKHSVAQLVAGYSEEATLYQMLFGLTSRQRRCLGDGGDLSEFVELIDEKDAVLNQIAALEAELEPIRTVWTAARAAAREKVAADLNPILDEMISTIQRTVALERDNEHLLETRRRELQRVLSDARRWRCASPDPIPADVVAPPPISDPSWPIPITA